MYHVLLVALWYTAELTTATAAARRTRGCPIQQAGIRTPAASRALARGQFAALYTARLSFYRYLALERQLLLPFLLLTRLQWMARCRRDCHTFSMALRYRYSTTSQVQRVIGHGVNINVNVRHRQRHKVGPRVPACRGVADKERPETPRDPTRQKKPGSALPSQLPSPCGMWTTPGEETGSGVPVVI